jgi:acyl-CoA synthetase (AMP-forming)/AMP-acid ligase II
VPTTTARAPDIGFRPTLAEMVRRGAREFGADDAIVTPTRRLSYAELELASRDLAKQLLEAGVGKGTRVGVLFPNSPEWVISFFAAARIGALVVPLSTFYAAPELRTVLRLADIHTLLCPATMFGRDHQLRLEEALPGLDQSIEQPLLLSDAPLLRSIWLAGAHDRAWARPWRIDGGCSGPPTRVTDDLLEAVEAEVTPADLAVLIHTSGTSADPKGVVHTHGAVVRHSYLLSVWGASTPPHRNVGRNERLFTTTVFFWVAGLQQDLLAQLHAGGALLLQELPDAATALPFMERERATTAADRGADLLSHPDASAHDLGAMKRLHSDAPDPHLPRHVGCGMTETLSNHSHAQDEFDRILPEELQGSCGLPLPYMEHRIVDPDTREMLPEGVEGVLLVRGFALMVGMNKREREEVFEPDGWYDTGDRCFIRDGYLFYVGRFGEMIKTSGANVAPLEVEVALMRLPEVQHATVFGIPDPTRDEIVAAVVVSTPGSEVTEQDLRQRLRQELSPYKVPKRFLFLTSDEFPLLHNGKTDRRALRRMLGADESSPTG